MATIRELMQAIGTAKEELKQHFSPLPPGIGAGLDFVDYMDKHWMMVGEKIYWSSVPFDTQSIESGLHLYSGSAYVAPHTTQWMFNAEDCAMFSLANPEEGRTYLAVFGKELECNDPQLRKLMHECW